jgi:hypothetical protein
VLTTTWIIRHFMNAPYPSPWVIFGIIGLEGKMNLVQRLQ